MKLPLRVVQGADLPGLEPAAYAVKVEGVVAHTPSDRALLARRARLVRLTLNTWRVGGSGGGNSSSMRKERRGRPREGSAGETDERKVCGRRKGFVCLSFGGAYRGP